MLMSVAIEASARVEGPTTAADGSTVYLPSSDGVCSLYTVDGTVTFKAVESGTIPNYKDFGVAFQPANEGDQIVITVNAIDISGGTRLIMYDGDVDYSTIGTSGAGGASPFTYFPAGWVKEITASDVNYTFTSTTDNGMVAFGCTTRGTTDMTGWDITVSSVSPKDMEYVSTTAITGLTNTWRGAKDQDIFGVDVVTDGGGNALTLDQLTIDASALAGSTQVTNVRLIYGTTVLATAATVGDALTATDVTLKNGHNRLMVVADILPDATGSIPSLTIQSVKVAGEACTATSVTGDAVTIDNKILMGTTPITYTIGDNAAFYDDGGKDATITQGFEGQVTFVPATPGQAIKVDFSKLELFNTSSVGYNDVFKFYNGREVNEENLIATLLDEAEIVKSTAEDGSLTVYLKSTAGYPKAGWEATVSQFLPGDMTFNAVTGEAASTATVAAGDHDVQMLVVDVLADNTSNPLHLTGINLNLADAKNVAKARAYSLGKKNTFATTDPFGEVEVTGTAIALTGDKELAEGHNYIAVVLDLNDQAQNGEQVTLSLQDVTVGGTTHTPGEAVSATRMVDNICHATQGSHSHNISGEWKFTHTEGYSGKYETADADYIVTFTPTIENTVAEIDFSQFDVYYSSSSYGTKAVFEIYSGTTVSGENLLWSLSDASEANVGPGKKIRSTSADGSLTIRFNPKTTSSYYAGTGWMATVRPFLNHDMTINEVTVNQTSSDVLAVGATDAALLDVEIVTEGTLTVKTLTGVKLDLKNSQEAVSRVSVYYNNENNRETAVAFGAVENPTASEVTVAGEHNLAEAGNYLWVTIDVKADAAAETVIDAKVTALVCADGETAVAEGDPDGNRVVKYIYNMASGDNIVTVTEPLMFYDDGGKDGKLTKGFKGKTIFVPGRDNSAVQIDTKSTFSIGSGKMYVYSGREANQDNLLGTVTGYSTTNGPKNLVSKAEDGALTVVFEANTTASTLDGWEIEVSLHEKTPFVVESIQIQPTGDAVLRNTTDNVMQQIKLAVSGDKNPIVVGSVKWDATGTTSTADITAVKVYSTGHNPMFGIDNCLGTATTVANGENVITLTEPLTIAENGDYYLWLTYDIAPEATAGNVVAAQVQSVTLGDAEMTVAEPLLAERTVKAGLKGTYVIGTSENADFATFAAATQALQGGVEGAVTFEVEDGTYAENVWFASVPGVSEQNTITFTSQSGDRDKVIVTGAGSSEVMPGTSSYKKGVFYAENTPYVTVQKMSFVPAKESEYNYVVSINDRSRHFTLRDCHVKATPVTSGYSGINLVKTMGYGEDNRNNDYATFEDNLLEGGYIAMALGGTNYVALTREKGLVVRGNTINEAGSKGIYVYDEDDFVIENNVIYQSTTKRTGFWGLDLARVRGKGIVAGNQVTSETTYYSGGIELRSESRGTADEPILVYNNVVSITQSPSNSSAGIEIDIDQKDIALYNNTVRIAGNGGYCFYSARRTPIAYENITLQNNLLQNMTSSPVMFIYSGYGDKPSMVNNVFYGETVMDGTDIAALNGMEGNSANTVEQAQFLSDVDLHLRSAGNLRSALPVDFITVDADGLERDAQNPTVGAYEFVELSEETPEIAEGYPVVTDITETAATVKTMWTVSGKLYSQVVKATEPEQGNAAPRKAPTADDLKAGTPQSVMAGKEATTTFDGLDENTKYEAYFLNVSALGNESEVVKAEFTTARHIEPLTVALEGATIEAGGEAELTPAVAGGDEPYTYEWTDQMNNNLGNEATLTIQPEYTWGYKVKVTSADGQTVTAKAGVIVRGEQVVATMDDNYLAENSHDEVYDLDSDKFYSGSFAFNQGAMPAYNYWYGYALTNETSTAYTGLNDQWRNAAGTGHNSANYLVAFPDAYASPMYIEVTNDAEGDSVMGMYVTNTAYAYNSMVSGDGYTDPFKAGSYFTMTVTGTAADGSTSTVDFNLGDYRAAEANRYVLDTWEWVDLRSLGKVTKLQFTFSGSETNNYGLTTPTYVALDDVGCMPDAAEVNVDVPAGQSVVDLAQYFQHADNGARERYYLNDVVDDDVMTVTLSEDNQLDVSAHVQQGKRTMLVSMTAKGHTQWLMLTLNINPTTGVSAVDAQRQVQSVQYVNTLGQVSDRPFEGVNIVVTRHADGTVTTSKIKY